MTRNGGDGYNSPILEQKHTFVTLNGMRGVAALCVVLLHETGFLAPFLARSGTLAVDFFFALSGFVLASAYGSRFDNGFGPADFIRARLVRLHPLAALGAFLGALYYVVLLLGRTPGLSPAELGVGIGTSLLLLPSPLPEHGLYPLNPPLWSLLFELLANLALVLGWRWLSLRVLAVILIASGAALLGWAATFGTVDSGSQWSTILGGALRVMFSFSIGVAVFKIRPIPNSLPSWLGPILLAVLAVFLVVAVGPVWLYQIAGIFIVFPALLWLGAQTEWDGLGTAAFLGRVSFPLYVIHWPLFQLLACVLGLKMLGHGAAFAFAPWTGLAMLAVVIATAWGLDRWFDTPARALLSQGLPRAIKAPSI